MGNNKYVDDASNIIRFIGDVPLITSNSEQDWRYCKCGHKADDHNPASLACYRCDCRKWDADLSRMPSDCGCDAGYACDD